MGSEMPTGCGGTDGSGKQPIRVNNAAKRLGLSRRMVRHLAKTGQLRGFKRGMRAWLFNPDDVDQYGAARRHRYGERE